MHLHIQTLDDSNRFNNSFKKGCWIVFFYAPWCHYCKEIMPEWLKFYNQQKNIKNKLNIAMLRDDQIQNTNIQHYDGFPTIKFYNNSKEQSVFNRERNSQELHNFSNENLNKILSKLSKGKKSKTAKKTKGKKPSLKKKKSSLKKKK